jgi:peptidoglycan/LPS O-acetylase OafA/YrhL
VTDNEGSTRPSRNPTDESTAPARGTRQRLDHVDAMRPIKQSAVISTHALIYFSPLSTSLLALSLLTLTHFSRDAFLFVSACMLAYSYRSHESVKLAPYWKRRLISVGLPYVVWSVIYFPIASMTPSGSFPYFSLSASSMFSAHGAHQFFFALATGYYHLYFLLVLLEFYVVFPYIYRFIRRYPLSHLPVLVGSVLWQFFYPYVVRHGWLGFVISGKLETRLVFSYPLYLLGGVVVALYLEQFHDWVLRFKVQILCATVVFGALPVVLDYIYKHGHHIPKIIAPGADPFAGAVIPYDVGAIIAVYLLGVYLVSPKRSAMTRAITASGSEAAYGIYLSQIVWLIFLHRWFLEWGVLRHVPWLAMTVFAIFFAYLVGFLFSALVARTPVARAVVGRGQVPWNTLIPHPSRHLTTTSDFGDGPMALTSE